MSLEDQQDANLENQESSDPVNDGNEQDLTPDPQEGEGQESQTDSPETPFHEHPRWQEMMEKQNQNAQREQEFQQKIADMEQRLEQALQAKEPAAKDPLLDRLKGLDPEFGTWAEQQQASAKQMEAMQQQLEAYQTQALNDKIDVEMKSLHEANKVPDFWRAKYENELNVLANKHPERFQNFDQLRNEYKQMHDGYTKYLESQRRETTKEYVVDKKKDASAPTSQRKGAPAKHASKKPDYKGDREAMLADVAKLALSKGSDSDI